MNKQDKIIKDNLKWYKADGDVDFSPARNKWVIDKTIRDNEKLAKRKKDDYEDKLRERTDAVATYLTSRSAESDVPVERYFGKRNMAHLRGQKIVGRLQEMINDKPLINLG